MFLVRSFSYTPHASFSEEFLLHPHASFSEVFLTAYTSSSEVFLLHMLVLDVSLTLVLVKCFSYTPHASFSEVFLLHTSY